MNKVYKASFNCGNDIITYELIAQSIKEARKMAKEVKRVEFDNDRRIKVTVRYRD